MDNLALIESFGDFKDDKNIDRITLMAIIEEALQVVLRKKYGSDDNFDIIVNPDKGDLEIWHNRIVVEDGSLKMIVQKSNYQKLEKLSPTSRLGKRCQNLFLSRT